MLEPVGNQALHREVQRRLKKYILEMGLSPGDRLPTETEMARRFGVSRNVVREALKGLEAIGLIEARTGTGTRIAHFDPAKYFENYTYNLVIGSVNYKELLEVRAALELAFVCQATQNIRSEDLAELDDLIKKMETALATGQSTLIPGLSIHKILYRSVDNRILHSLLDAFAEILDRIWEPIYNTVSREYLERDLAIHLAIHRRLVEALHRRDESAVQAALKEDFALDNKFSALYNEIFAG